MPACPSLRSTRRRAWDRHGILAEIKSRFGSLQKFAAETPLSAHHFSVAFGRPYPQAESLIAEKLGIPAFVLWPDRYFPNGQKRPNPSRGKRARASQKHGRRADRKAAR